MRVLLWMVGGDRVPGGHLVQLQQTSKHLRLLGVDTDISFAEEQELVGYSLVHGFGLGALEIRRCREHGLPIVLSTIYWSRTYTMGQHDTGRPLDRWKHRARMGLVLLRSSLQGSHIEKCEALVERIQNMRVAYEMADLLLPNSVMEVRTIQAELGVTTPYHVAPNAVDHASFRLDNTASNVARNHVLYAGRFEPHKNQLGLIEAMRGSPIPVVLVGPPHPDHAAYYEQCKRKATSNITFLPAVPHEELPGIYVAARVHVLPSWFETTGLVSLEAALCGCNIVTTERGYARDYFQDMAWYCSPADPRSIRRAIEAAFQAPHKTELRDRILNNYTWEQTARATLEGYHRVVRNTVPHAVAEINSDDPLEVTRGTSTMQHL